MTLAMHNLCEPVFPLGMEVWGHWDLHFLETEGPFSLLRVPTLLKLLHVCVGVYGWISSF